MILQLDVESVEEDHDNITEEESIIQTALSQLDQRYGRVPVRLLKTYRYVLNKF
jgi:hypothetical protein